MNSFLKNKLSMIDKSFINKAIKHQNSLTKPPGSLGRLEQLAIQLSGLQQTNTPSLDRVAIRVFAGDHGITEEGVSAFPQAVTVEMIRNFAEGGAAISVLAKEVNADFAVINTGTAYPVIEHSSVISKPVASGTKNFIAQPAMSEAQLESALEIGLETANALKQSNIQIFIGGEMGIGNTTSASAIACSLLSQPAEKIAGLGTGIDNEGLQRKINVINQALEKHSHATNNPLESLRCFGGFEIAALTGAYIACAQNRIPSLVDGFICSVAALTAVRIQPDIADWLFYSHHSAENGHSHVLEALNAKPLLDLGMRLGEASGAAVALPLLRMACSLHNNMATFDSAEVSVAISDQEGISK